MHEPPCPQPGQAITFCPRSVATTAQPGRVLAETDRNEFGRRQWRVRWHRLANRKRGGKTVEVDEPIEEPVTEDRIIAILPTPPTGNPSPHTHDEESDSHADQQQ